MRPSNCQYCGSTKFFQESATVFRCEDCFDRVTLSQPIDTFETVSSKQKLPVSLPNKHQLQKIFWIFVFFSVSFSSFFTVIGNLTKDQVSTTIEELEPNAQMTEFEPAIEILNFGFVPDVIGNIYYIGKFKNIDERALDFTKIEISLVDNEQNVIGSYFGYAESNAMSSGDVSYFNVLMENPPSYHSYTVKFTAMERTYSIPESNFVITGLKLKKSDHGYSLVGKMINDNAKIMNYTKVDCILLNKAGEIIDINYYYLTDENFEPFSSKDIQVDFSVTKVIPKSFECIGNGTPKIDQ
ncbi:hypothetical protein P3G55_13295 [Leptospira sp. 96542]|nr:hypothetical protein [Leptospira sp. 96542]